VLAEISLPDDVVMPVSTWDMHGVCAADQMCAAGAAACRHTSPAVLVPALRTVGNIVTGNDMQTQVRCAVFFVPLLLCILAGLCWLHICCLQQVAHVLSLCNFDLVLC
jgi:hypothetical protein